MKIAVFAGTPVDVKMGEDILIASGYSTLGFPMSKNPMEQTKIQYYGKDKLEEIFKSKLVKAKSQGAKLVFIYCNSLSAAINYKEICKDENIPVITPFEIYENLDEKYINIAIIAANAISAYVIDRLLNEKKFRNTISFGNLNIVNEIEKALPPMEIIDKLNLKYFLRYLEGINSPYKIDCILLGCTHFPYLKTELKKLTYLNIIDPADKMVELVKERTK